MTQRLLIINLGDKPVTLTKGDSICASETVLYPNQLREEYVWNNATLKISEKSNG